MSSHLALAFVLLAFFTPGEARQIRPGAPPGFAPLPPGTGSISGRVVEAKSGEPLANVAVALTALMTFGGNKQTTTDAAGFYRFVNLAEHDYNVVIMDPLYLGTCYEATEPTVFPCGTISVVRDQQRAGIDFRLSLAAVLRGRVVDSEGRAVGGATVAAGPGPPASPTLFGRVTAQTRPDGTFELTRLAGGDIVLSLDMPVTADTPRAPTVFYPGVVTAGAAEPIKVTAGLVTTGIIFRFPKVASRSLTARISAPASGATAIKAWLYRVEPRMVRAIAIGADGSGSVTGLLEGRYFVAAEAQGDSARLVAYEVVELLHDTVELALLLQEPGAITGRIVAERGGLPPLADVRVAAKWTDEGEEVNPLATDEAMVGSDGSFRLDDLFGLRSVQLLGLPRDWHVQSIRHGRDGIPPTGITVAPGVTLDVVVTVARR